MSKHIEVPAEDLETLRKFDTPTVCNVIELFGVVPNSAGYMDQRIQACFPQLPPMVGYASTAIFSSQAPHNDPEAIQGMDLMIESFENLPGPPVVVYQDIDQPAA
ncbi:MAG: RraA family protein, partial [Lentisphaeria bacterium]|nr:RraA family protein [Lentisphaeria bacterium]